jgi:hypothetical protein
MKYNIRGTFEENYSSCLRDERGEETSLEIRVPYTELMRKVLWFAESDLFIEDRPDILELMMELKNALAKRVKDHERLKELESHMQPVLGRVGYNVRADYGF